jgi:anti-sigma-K factor RskA
MNPVLDVRFLELAMKSIAGQASAAERGELESLLAREPERREEFARLEAQARLARTVLPLAEAVNAPSPTLPAYARERLRTKVRQTLRSSDAGGDERAKPTSSVFAGWRWVLGLVGATAVLAVVFLPKLIGPREPVIEVAMFDPAGPARGASADETAIVQELWPSAGLREFVDLRELDAWLARGEGSARRPSVRIVYDRPAAEIRVAVRQGARVAETTIPVEPDLRSALGKAREFIESVFTPSPGRTKP